MKRIAIGLVACAAVTLCLSGCAGLSTAAKNDFEVDKARVATIERAAARFGYQVVWVNPPLKRAAAAPGS